MKVKIKKLHPNAVIPFKKHKEDFCLDCVAVSCEEVAPNIYKYGLGFAIEIDRASDEALIEDTLLSIDIRSRSSVWKTGMVLSNGSGTVDESYRGEVSAVFYHIMPNMPKYEIGDRICQLKIGCSIVIEFEETETLSETERGAGGYGSTGR